MGTTSDASGPDEASQQLQLLPGEQLDWSRKAAFNQRLSTVRDQQHVEGDFRIVTEQARYQVAQIPDLVRGADWDLNPDFQRRHRWDEVKQSRLIESIIMNVPIPPIFLYEVELGRFEVMDGLQRLTAIGNFYNDRFALQDLEFWSTSNGLTYSDLPETIQRTIGRRYLSAVVLLHETGKSPMEANLLKQLVFERINSGGVDLSPQESRNALLPGPMNNLSLELSRTPSFCRLWRIPEEEEQADEHAFYRNMYDAELVLRFFAYRQRFNAGPQRNLRGFLDSYLRGANSFPPGVIDELRILFRKTVDLVEDVLGEKAFWLYRYRDEAWQWVAEPTVVAYEPVMLAFSQRLDSAQDLKVASTEIRAQVDDFYRSHEGVFDGRKVNVADLILRNVTYLDFLDSFIRA